MQLRDNFAMDNSDTYQTKKSFMTLTKATFFLFSAIFVCSLVAVGLLVYNFAACPQIDETKICENHHYQVHEDFNIQATTTTASFSSSSSASESGVDVNATKVIQNVRLPRAIRPMAYDVKLLPFLIVDNFTFIGEVEIKIVIVEDCKNITLHSVSLKIHQNLTRVYDLTTNISIPIKKQYFVDDKQFLIIDLDGKLEKGKEYLIKMKFEGILNDYLQGFYRSSYTVGNETRWAATTQFQSTDARRAFPSFDEPELKATFKITMGRPRHLISLSNMPQEKTVISNDKLEPVEGYVWDIYQESVPMSTYLVAFVVCDFVNKTVNGNFSVWARPDAIRSAQYALDVGPRVFKFLEEFFDIKYPLPKVDMIALPDFSFGAMENFGLITYRETAMLYEEGVSALSKKQTVADVVSHEISHQWFGNLVTPHWWNDLWLNEGFASYMEYLCVNAIEPEWKSLDQFVINELQNVFALDALSSSHQISVEVENPDQINEIFDSISYAKGASVIRSMENFLTSDVFKGGLRKYLKKYSYQTATQDDLWHELTMEARLQGVFDETMSVKEIMDTWTLQTGFPFVTVTRNYENNQINLQQDRFMLIEAPENTTTVATNQETQKNLWYVPISLTTRKELNFNSTEPSHWMKATKNIVFEKDIMNADWLILNIQVTGYYRVNYDLTNWKLIINHLNDPKRFKEIAPANRAQLMDDAMNLARADILDYRTALEVTKYLVHEVDYVPWKTAINGLNYIDSMLIRSPDYDKFKKYFLHKLENIYKAVGFEDVHGDFLTVLNRFDVLNAACHLGMKDCVNNCMTKFYMWMNEANPDINNPISPNMKSIVYCTTIKHGDQVEWDFLWDRYQKTTISSEKETLLSAMGCSREPWILTRFLERSISEKDNIRRQDTFRVFSAVSNNVLGQPIAFNFIRDNWTRMKDFFSLGSSFTNLNSVIKYSTKKITHRSQLNELKIFAKNEIKDTGRTIQQVIERAEANVMWHEKNYKKIVSWLEEQEM